MPLNSVTKEPDYAAAMKLPPGLTCAACVHGPRCNAFFGAVREGFTSCDFYPSRFRPTGSSSALAYQVGAA